MSLTARALTAALICVCGLAADARADGTPPTKEQCASANEGAQSSRKEGKLRAARAQLLVCAAKSCPQVVRDDCAERLNDLDAATPSIVFTAKGANDADVTNVRVTMDGLPFADRLDGSAINVDPGMHTFELRADGYPPATTKLVIREGAKRRQEVVSLAVPPAKPPAPLAASKTGPSVALEPPPSGGAQRTAAFVLGGVGMVGLGLGAFFGLRARATYNDASSHCPTSSSCDDRGVTGGRDAHTEATVSTIAFAAGGTLLAGGVILYLTAPRQGAVGLQPAAGTNMAGLRLGGAW